MKTLNYTEKKKNNEAAMEMPGLRNGSHSPDSRVQALREGSDGRPVRYGFLAWWTGQGGTVGIHSRGRHIFLQAEAVSHAGKAAISVPMRKELEKKITRRSPVWLSTDGDSRPRSNRVYSWIRQVDHAATFVEACFSSRCPTSQNCEQRYSAWQLSGILFTSRRIGYWSNER